MRKNDDLFAHSVKNPVIEALSGYRERILCYRRAAFVARARARFDRFTRI